MSYRYADHHRDDRSTFLTIHAAAMLHTRPVILPHPELASTLPGADVNALMELPDTSQIRAWTQQKAVEYKNHLSTLLAIYNSIAPINTLPTEILQQTFSHVPCTDSWCDALWLLSLGLVCRRWHSVLLATPEYWAQGLHAVMDPDYYWYCRGDNRSDASDAPDNCGDNDIAKGRALFLTLSAPWPLKIPLEYSDSEDGPGWQAFGEHFDRVTVFEVIAQDADELDGILSVVTTYMKRLERLRIEADYPGLSPLLFDWEAEDLSHLGSLEITSGLFCSVTTVPSLHTVILTAPPRDISSLPQLLDALEKCSALATLRLELTHNDDTFQNRALERTLNLPNLRTLAIGGGVSDVRCFLSALSFPSATRVELDVIDTGNEQDRGLVLPNVLPRRLSAIRAYQLLDGIDRLCFYSNYKVGDENQRAAVSMQGHVQGARRLRVNPAFWFHNTGCFLQILVHFRECRVTELALDLRYAPSDMDGQFWPKFFAALPDLRRLELLSPTAETRVTKRDIATHYLASRRVPPLASEASLAGFSHPTPPPRHAVSLAWVLHADEREAAQLQAELTDVERVLRDYANSGARVDRLELYVTTFEPHLCETQALDVTEVETSSMASCLVARDYVSRLEAVADIVVVGGGREGAEFDALMG